MRRRPSLVLRDFRADHRDSTVHGRRDDATEGRRRRPVRRIANLRDKWHCCCPAHSLFLLEWTTDTVVTTCTPMDFSLASLINDIVIATVSAQGPGDVITCMRHTCSIERLDGVATADGRLSSALDAGLLTHASVDPFAEEPSFPTDSWRLHVLVRR